MTETLDDFIRAEAQKVGFVDLTEEELQKCRDDLSELFPVVLSFRKAYREMKREGETLARGLTGTA